MLLNYVQGSEYIDNLRSFLQPPPLPTLPPHLFLPPSLRAPTLPSTPSVSAARAFITHFLRSPPLAAVVATPPNEGGSCEDAVHEAHVER